MSAAGMLTVVVVARERVTYRREVQMTQAEFDRLDKVFDGRDRHAKEFELERLIDRNDGWFDADDLELDDMYIEEAPTASQTGKGDKT